jgi:hypothetical protein
VKTWSLLQDPEIKEELVAYLQSNKWSMDPAKLIQYSESQMVTLEMRKYIQTAVNKEMLRGLKKYLEVELFLRIGYKVSQGISLATAQCWFHKQGFEYMEVKKGLFYDGQEHPDVVTYHQNVFIPTFDRLRPLLVEYNVDNLQNQVVKLLPPPGEFQLILTPHDEMTAQANNADKSKWVLKGEMPIRKKGAGCRIHHSDIICSTVGHVDDAGEGMKYGNNYEGYWDGARFIKQVIVHHSRQFPSNCRPAGSPNHTRF